MTYTPYHADWKDYPDVTTPITAAALEYIEAGIVDAAAGSGFTGTYDLSDYCVIDGSTDDSTALQSLIDGVDDGSLIWHPGGKCKLSSTVDLSNRQLTFVGPFGVTYRTTTVGAWFIAGDSAMTMFTSGTDDQVNEVGQTFQRIGFHDAASESTSTCFDIKSINRMRFSDCAFLNWSTCRKWDCNGHDSAYHVVSRNGYYMAGASSVVDNFVECLDFKDFGSSGIISGTFGTIAPKSSLIRHFGTTVGGGLTGWDVQGSFCEWHGCCVEWTASGSTRYGWKFYGNTGTHANSGKENKVFGGRVSGQGSGHYVFDAASTAKGCAVVGVSANNLASPPWSDAGVETYIDIPSYGTFTNLPYRKIGNVGSRGAKLGFYGAPEAAKPTVTGSRGSNAALASLLTALSTLGLVTDSSS